MTILESLQERKGFTQTDEALADFILDNLDSISHLTIGTLAKEAFTSTAAINRLCRRIGLSGFREFRVNLVTELERMRDARDVGTDLTVSSGQSVIATMTDLRGVLKKAIDATFASTDPLLAHDCARTILRCGKLVYYAGGDTAVTCKRFANNLCSGIVVLGQGDIDCKPRNAFGKLGKIDDFLVLPCEILRGMSYLNAIIDQI